MSEFEDTAKRVSERIAQLSASLIAVTVDEVALTHIGPGPNESVGPYIVVLVASATDGSFHRRFFNSTPCSSTPSEGNDVSAVLEMGLWAMEHHAVVSLEAREDGSILALSVRPG